MCSIPSQDLNSDPDQICLGGGVHCVSVSVTTMLGMVVYLCLSVCILCVFVFVLRMCCVIMSAVWVDLMGLKPNA